MSHWCYLTWTFTLLVFFFFNIIGLFHLSNRWHRSVAVSAILRTANSTWVTLGHASEVHSKENESHFSVHSAYFWFPPWAHWLQSALSGPLRRPERLIHADSLTFLHAQHLCEICGELTRRSSEGGRRRQVSGVQPSFQNNYKAKWRLGNWVSSCQWVIIWKWVLISSMAGKWLQRKHFIWSAHISLPCMSNLHHLEISGNWTHTRVRR